MDKSTSQHLYVFQGISQNVRAKIGIVGCETVCPRNGCMCKTGTMATSVDTLMSINVEEGNFHRHQP